jgi:hypothetical protein
MYSNIHLASKYRENEEDYLNSFKRYINPNENPNENNKNSFSKIKSYQNNKYQNIYTNNKYIINDINTVSYSTIMILVLSYSLYLLYLSKNK